MIEIFVELSGDAAKKIVNASYKLASELDKAILTAAIFIASEVKKKIQRGGRSGRLYKGGKSQRSAPGQPPKSDTGNLVKLTRWEHSFLTASVGSEANYAGYLELGTSKMAARPFLVPTLEENQDKIDKLVEAAITRAMG